MSYLLWEITRTIIKNKITVDTLKEIKIQLLNNKANAEHTILKSEYEMKTIQVDMNLVEELLKVMI